MEEKFNLADIKTVTDNVDGWGGGNAIWLILFIVLMGGFGGWGSRNQSCATIEDLAQGFNFSGLQNKTNEILAAVNSEGRTTDNAICQLGYNDLEQFNQLSRQLADCCCATQRAIDGVKFDMANYSASTNQQVATWGQKVLDKLCEDKTERLQQRIQQLELQQATAGIPRTNPFGYGIYAYPQCCGQASCCNNI